MQNTKYIKIKKYEIEWFQQIERRTTKRYFTKIKHKNNTNLFNCEFYVSDVIEIVNLTIWMHNSTRCHVSCLKY